MKYLKTYLLHKSLSDYKLFENIDNKIISDIFITLKDKGFNINIHNSGNAVMITTSKDYFEYDDVVDELKMMINYLRNNGINKFKCIIDPASVHIQRDEYTNLPRSYKKKIIYVNLNWSKFYNKQYESYTDIVDIYIR